MVAFTIIAPSFSALLVAGKAVAPAGALLVPGKAVAPAEELAAAVDLAAAAALPAAADGLRVFALGYLMLVWVTHRWLGTRYELVRDSHTGEHILADLVKAFLCTYCYKEKFCDMVN